MRQTTEADNVRGLCAGQLLAAATRRASSAPCTGAEPGHHTSVRRPAGTRGRGRRAHQHEPCETTDDYSAAGAEVFNMGEPITAATQEE